MKKDFDEAVRLYRLSADQGNVTAQNNLGTLYRAGIGVEKDLDKAELYYSLAADQGNVTAQFYLDNRKQIDAKEFTSIEAMIKKEISELIAGLSSEDFSKNANLFIEKVTMIRKSLLDAKQSIVTIDLKSEFNAIALELLVEEAKKAPKNRIQLLVAAADVFVQNFAADPSSLENPNSLEKRERVSFLSLQSLPNQVRQTLALYGKREELKKEIAAHLTVDGVSNIATEYLLGKIPSADVKQSQAKGRETRKLRDAEKETDKKDGGCLIS